MPLSAKMTSMAKRWGFGGLMVAVLMVVVMVVVLMLAVVVVMG